MVSKARLDLPEPERPVTTTRLSRGISSDTFFRLCTRAPCTAMVVRAAGFGAPLPAFDPFDDCLAATLEEACAAPAFFWSCRLTAAVLEAIRCFPYVKEC